MDVEKLIEQLNDFNENHIAVLCGSGQCACGYLCDKDDCIVVRAAAALSTLQAENEKLRADVVRLNDLLASYQNVLVPELRTKNEKLQAELEQVKWERDAAVSDLETIMAYNSDTCQFCKNGQCYVRGGTKSCLPKWRGQKEE